MATDRGPMRSVAVARPLFNLTLGFVLVLLAACGQQPGATRSAEVETAFQGATDAAPSALPTPTLAAGAVIPVPKPPTPEVMPSPTPAGSTADAPAPAITDAGPPAATAGTTSPAPAVTSDFQLPEGATGAELVTLGQTLLNYGNYPAAAKAYQTALSGDDLSPAERGAAQEGFGLALLNDGQASAAAGVFSELSAQALDGSAGVKGPGDLNLTSTAPDRAAFHLGQARLATGDNAGAIESFTAYLQRHPDMAAYVQPLIAEALAAAGDTAGAIAAYEAALEAPSHRLANIAIRRKVAELQLAAGNYAAAIAQYDAIHDQAVTETTRGEMTYLAGKAELAAGNTQAGYERYLYGVNNYPRAAQSYWGLIELVEAGVPVDEYQRGVVDFYAAAYQPGVEAFQRYLDANPETYQRDTHLYLAWTYEALGNLEAALAELDTYAETDGARATLERAQMLARTGRGEEALAAFEDFLSGYPEAEGAPAAAWEAAALAEDRGDANTVDRYLYLAENYPAHEDAPRAIARAAWLAGLAGDDAKSLELYRRLAEQYPQNEYGSEALVWLMRLAAGDQASGLDLDALREQARALKPSHYFAIRARDVADGVAPFSADEPMTLPAAEPTDRREAEAWLREWLVANGTIPPEGDLGALSPELAADPRLAVGRELWALGLYEEAKGELEALRQANADDPLANYQLAIALSEIGLYRSSIIAAATLLNQVGMTVFDAPRFLGRLSYPAHFADMIQPLAEQYGFDPRLQFALVRQESLFESFATSSAAAQGLSQVIPDTGAWIAQQLAWPDYDNADLYKPYVGLTFGAYYLSRQLEAFDNQVHAALAAYNAGPGNAARWYEIAGSDHDGFVDAIDFSETRQYVQRIYEGFSAYRHLYGR